MVQLTRMREIVEAPNSDLPRLVREECLDLVEQIAELTRRIDTRTKKAKKLAAEADMARRLQTMPGVGPLTALAIEAFAPAMDQMRARFRSLAGPRSASAFFRRKGPAWAYPQGRAYRYSPVADHRCDDAVDLARPQRDPTGYVVGAHVAEEAEDAGSHRARQQDGAWNMGHGDEKRRLQGTKRSQRCLTEQRRERKPDTREWVREGDDRGARQGSEQELFPATR